MKKEKYQKTKRWNMNKNKIIKKDKVKIFFRKKNRKKKKFFKKRKRNTKNTEKKITKIKHKKANKRL